MFPYKKCVTEKRTYVNKGGNLRDPYLLTVLLSIPFDKLFWSCLRDLHADKLHEAILSNLKKLSFATMGSGQIHDDHPNHHFFTPEGHLVSTKRLVYIVDQDDGLQRVSYYQVIIPLIKQSNINHGRINKDWVSIDKTNLYFRPIFISFPAIKRWILDWSQSIFLHIFVPNSCTSWLLEHCCNLYLELLMSY